MSDKKIKENDYNADAITVLEGLDPVRKRPGMYIGSTASTGLHHLIWEVVDNGIDEAMAGHATEVTVTLLPEGMIKVTDNGRGIPVNKHKITGVSALENRLKALAKLYVEDQQYPLSARMMGFVTLRINSRAHHEGMMENLRQILAIREIQF